VTYVTKVFEVPSFLDHFDDNDSIKIEIEVVNGVVSSVQIHNEFVEEAQKVDQDLIDLSQVLLKEFFDNKLVNKFSDELIHLQEFSRVSNAKKAFLCQCFDMMISKFV